MLFLRLTRALAARGADIRAIVRTRSELATAAQPDVPFEALPLRSVWDPLSRWEVARALKKSRPDIVQTHMGRATRLTHLPRGRGPLHIARLSGYHKLHGYRHAHAWLCATRGLRDYLVAAGFPAARVFQVPNFVDRPELRPQAQIDALRRSLGIPEDAWVLLTPGRFVAVKGHHYLLAALERVVEINARPVHLVLLGEGEQRAILQRQAARAGLDERIRWVDWQTEPGPYYQLADLVVFPSLEQEAFGNVILEAWAHGKPLVTSAFRGALEITRQGDDAWRVPCADAPALASGIQTVLEDEDLAQGLAAQGLERVNTEFSTRTVVARYLALYEELLNAAPTR